jgi:hypothetical protein
MELCGQRCLMLRYLRSVLTDQFSQTRVFILHSRSARQIDLIEASVGLGLLGATA